MDIDNAVIDGLALQVSSVSTGDEPPKTAPDHLLWMLGEIRSQRISGTKAHRWLGFVQGVLASRRQLDVDTERARTRPHLTVTN